jgi:hypothetical protein
MTQTSRTSLTLCFLSAGLCAGLTAFFSASPNATAGEMLFGHYNVSNAFSEAIPAPFYVKVQATNGTQTGTQTIRCILPNAELSQQAYCPQLDVTLDVAVYDSGEHASVVEIDFLHIEQWAVNHNLDVLAIDPVPPDSNAAEAEWLGWPENWECITSEADAAACNVYCGIGGGDVSADPWPSDSNNAFIEPACEVHCECDNSDREKDWKDFPQVMPAF